MTITQTYKVKGLLSQEKILEMQLMEEPCTLAISILGNVLTSCFFFKPTLLEPICSRMIELVAKHGLFKYSSIATSGFAVVLSGKTKIEIDI